MSQQLEDRLRSALRAEAEGLRLSTDPWQQNRRRVAASASGRRRRVLVATAAAVLAVATALGAGSLLSGPDGSGASPAGGGGGGGAGDPFTAEYLLGAPVEAETLTIDGKQTVHTIALSDMTGQGPNLCDRYDQVVAEGAGSSNGDSVSGGCTTRDPAADEDGVAFDWLMGTEGSGDIRGVAAGVDRRVSFVDIWMSNGAKVPARLEPGGWEGSRLFAVTVPSGGQVPQRLVALGRDGNVLEAVDLVNRFGGGWLSPRSACAGDSIAEYVPFVPEGEKAPNAYVALGSGDAQLSIRLGKGSGTRVCIPRFRSQALAGWHHGGRLVVAVVAPEVVYLKLNAAPRGQEAMPLKSPEGSGSPWRVVEFRSPTAAGFATNAELVAMDRYGLELDRQFIDEPSAP